MHFAEQTTIKSNESAENKSEVSEVKYYLFCPLDGPVTTNKQEPELRLAIGWLSVNIKQRVKNIHVK